MVRAKEKIDNASLRLIEAEQIVFQLRLHSYYRNVNGIWEMRHSTIWRYNLYKYDRINYTYLCIYVVTFLIIVVLDVVAIYCNLLFKWRSPRDFMRNKKRKMIRDFAQAVVSVRGSVVIRNLRTDFDTVFRSPILSAKYSKKVHQSYASAREGAKTACWLL